MKLNKNIPFSNKMNIISCVPTIKHCSKGPKASASVSTLDILAVSQGLKDTVEVWDQLERKLYVFDAQTVMRSLYFCGASEFMAFSYKKLKPTEIR